MKTRTFLALALTYLSSFALAVMPLRADLPPEAQAAVDKGILAAKDAQDYLLAVRYFQEARKIAPGEPDIYYKLGVAEGNIPGRELRAICWLEAYLTVYPNLKTAAAVKKQIDVLDVKSQSRLYKIIKPVQDAANKISDASNQDALTDVAGLFAEAGDVASALEVADTITGWKGKAYAKIATGQADTGDFAGALKTAELIKTTSSSAYDIDSVANDRAKEESEIATIQIEQLCDVTGAKITLMSALNAVNQIQNDEKSKKFAMNWVGMVSGDIPAMAISHNFNRMGATEEEQTNQAVVVAEIQAAVQPAIPAIKVSDWLEKLDGDNEYGVCALNTKPFLDFASYLASIPSSNDAQTQFRALKDAAEKIIKAQNVIDMMLKLQAKQPAIAPDPFAVARNNADQIQGDYARATAINNLIDSEMKAGDVAGAQKTSDLFQNEISSNPGWYYLAQCKIGEAQAKAGDVTGAHETFATALQNINQFDAIKDINSEQNRDNAEKKSTCQVYIAVAQANIGDITDALKTADLIQDVNRKSQALRDIATDQAKAGDIAGAQKTADLIQDANYKSQAQKTIADDQAKP